MKKQNVIAAILALLLSAGLVSCEPGNSNQTTETSEQPPVTQPGTHTPDTQPVTQAPDTQEPSTPVDYSKLLKVFYEEDILELQDALEEKIGAMTAAVPDFSSFSGTVWRVSSEEYAALDSLDVKAGDLVLFESGKTYEGQLVCKSGVTYAASGKPAILSGSVLTAAADWEATETSHVYRYVGAVSGVSAVFSGEQAASPVLVQEDASGVSYDVLTSLPFAGYSDLYGDFTFCEEDDVLYVRCTAETLPEIALGVTCPVIADGTEQVTLSGLTICQAVGGAIQAQNVSGLTIQSCTVRQVADGAEQADGLCVSGNVACRDSYFTGISGAVVRMAGQTELNVTGCVFRACGSGIAGAEATGSVTVEQSSFWKMGDSGILTRTEPSSFTLTPGEGMTLVFRNNEVGLTQDIGMVYRTTEGCSFENNVYTVYYGAYVDCSGEMLRFGTSSITYACETAGETGSSYRVYRYSENDGLTNIDPERVFWMLSPTIKVGEEVIYGIWEQDNDDTEHERLRWIVANIDEEGHALLICNKVLVARNFDTPTGSGVWSESSLRSWLNGTFYKSAFTEGERGRMVAAENGGMEDMVFLPTAEQVNAFLAPEKMVGVPTEYVAQSSSLPLNAAGSCSWWLLDGSCVFADGTVGSSVLPSSSAYIVGVRPAIIVQLS